jgi:hypothetical protein
VAVDCICFTSQSRGVYMPDRENIPVFCFYFPLVCVLFWAWGKRFIFCYKQYESLIKGYVYALFMGGRVEVALIASNTITVVFAMRLRLNPRLVRDHK